MNGRDRLRAETLAYLEASINRDLYLEHPDNPLLLNELTSRVLNARSWKHGLDTFEEVVEVVKAAARSAAKAAPGGDLKRG